MRDTLLSTADEDLYLPYWSQKILDEAIGNLVKGGKLSQKTAKNLENQIKLAFPEAMVEVPVALEQAMTNDPKDRHVLAAAVTAGADIIVTNNLKDFRENELAPWNIKAQSPDDFLSDLLEEYPDSIIELLQQQSQKYKNPPKTFTELIDFLREKADTPKFASNILFKVQRREDNQ
ncbi:MAG: PIN domain-containing protein [Microcoleus sp. PH2017_22_RUC_O_B]|nr:PIN domain-containing protein [Microcoleus sp. PH2017_22_RUC_O_B]